MGGEAYPCVLKWDLEGFTSSWPDPIRTTVSAPYNGRYKTQVHITGHDSDGNGKFVARIGKNGTWSINKSDNTDLSGTWEAQFTCAVGDQLMVELGGYFPDACSYIFLFLGA